MLVVTGGGGFIGSVLAAELNDSGSNDLVIVDRFGNGDKWRNIAKRDFVEIVPVDGLLAWLDRFGDGVEVIFHLGAISATTETDADLMIANNLNYSIALWRWCAAAKKPLIYASSAATYGDGAAGFDDAGDIEEFKRLRPMNLYGWSKHAFDLWVLRQAAAGFAPPLWVGLKFFNVFGPNEHHKGDMMSLVVKNYRKVATGEARTFLDLMNALGAACGVAPKIEYIDIPPEIRPDYQYFTQASMSRLRQAGYNAPFTPLEAAVRDCVVNHLAQ